MFVSKFLSVLCASVVLAAPIIEDVSSGRSLDEAFPAVARDASGSAPAVSSVAPPTLQTGTPPSDLSFNMNVKKKPTGPVKANGGALTPGWVEPGSDEFIDICLYHHNCHRANHSAPAVVWNETLASQAQWKSDKCQWSEGVPANWGTLGINIAGGSYGIPKVKPNPSDMITGLWYNSEMENFPEYGVASPPMGNFENWGHFTQVVWPGSHQIGCGLTDCGNKWFGLCLYKPAGNWLGEFNKIGEPKGYAMVFPNGHKKM